MYITVISIYILPKYVLVNLYKNQEYQKPESGQDLLRPHYVVFQMVPTSEQPLILTTLFLNAI